MNIDLYAVECLVYLKEINTQCDQYFQTVCCGHRETERESVCVCVRERESVCVYVSVCVSVSVCVCVLSLSAVRTESRSQTDFSTCSSVKQLC